MALEYILPGIVTQESPAVMHTLEFKEEPGRVLLVLPAWVGDVVMATPFVRALFMRFPDAEITLLMNHHLYPLLEGSPWVQHCEFWAPRKQTAEANHIPNSIST